MSGNKTNQGSLSVAEYTDILIRKYLHQAFDDQAEANLTKAAEEMYVLLRKLSDATGKQSDDAKAPLKAVRTSIDKIITMYPERSQSPEVEALFQLLNRLQQLCDERVADNTDLVGGHQVSEHLRYRLTRLITGEKWDSHQDLKMQALQLIFSFMVADNQRILAESRDVPSLKLTRTYSLGRGNRSRDLGPRKISKWAESIDEIGRMPGNKLVPLMKLLLAENFQLRSFSSVRQETPAHQENLDLLAFNNQNDDASKRSSSPAPSSVITSDDPFAYLMATAPQTAASTDADRQQEELMMQNQMHRMSLEGNNNVRASSPGTLSTYSAPPSIQTPPGSTFHPSANISTGAPGHFGALPFNSPFPHSHSGGGSSSATPTPQNSYLHRLGSQGSGEMLKMNTSTNSFDPKFDAASPYLGIPQPFTEDNFFKDVAPALPPKGPAPPTAQPPMRPLPQGYRQ